MYANQTDPVLQMYADYIDDWAYVSQDFATTRNHTAFINLLDDPNGQKMKAEVTGMSPSTMLDTSIFKVYYNETSAIGLTTGLYTAGGG